MMQVLELVVDNGLTRLACRCQLPLPLPLSEVPEHTFTVAEGTHVIARCPPCNETAEFDLPRRARLPVDQVAGSLPEQLGEATSFVFLRSAGFALNVVNGAPRCHCPQCTN